MVPVLPAAVITVEDSWKLPEGLLEMGESLGQSGKTWRVEALPGQSGVELAKAWKNRPGVRFAEPDMLLPHSRWEERFNDPDYLSQWYHESLNTELLYDLSLGNPDVYIAVIDSAIETAHPEFVGSVIAPLDVYGDDNDPNPEPGEYCFEPDDMSLCDTHGTAVAGIAVAQANNNEGIVGLCPECSLIPIRLLGEYYAPLSGDVKAFEHAIDNGAWVINNSWGYSDYMPVSDTLRAVIVRAATEGRNGLGAVVVFAAGNDDREILDDELAAIPEVVSVTAIDHYGNPTPYTNTGATVDIAAPSATVSTSVNGGYTQSFGGTSAASPVVAGVAGLILSIHPEYSAEQVRALLTDSAKKDGRVTFDENGHHNTFGFGFLSPEGIVETWRPAPEAVPDEPEMESGGCTAVQGPLWILLLTLMGLRRFRDVASVV
ncbi:MAG: S8 family serine peptidase [Deltaproteobacteria bacterium]|jgi:serine protease|nr:S8 family serine peptidase [Deltaproteobacteria bacterium]